MTKPKVTPNYNEADRKRLLAAVAEVLPVRRAHWNSVAEQYNASGSTCGPPRDAVSLKRKFAALYKSARESSSRALSADTQGALQLRLKIVRLSRAAPLQETVSCSGNQSSPSQTTQAVVRTAGPVAPSSKTTAMDLERNTGNSSLAGADKIHTTVSTTPCGPGECTDDLPESRPAQPTCESTHCDALLDWLKRHYAEYDTLLREDRRRKVFTDTRKQRQLDIERLNVDQRHRELLASITSLRES